jgi:formamidopyrimidine-DNA glycosylase
MRASYDQGGASIRNYRQVNGEPGDFTFEFEVYAQKLDPLGNIVIREETPDGRTTHWVPSLQS